MKKKLLGLSFLITTMGFSQSIASFESNPNTIFTILNPVTSINQTTSGTNATWTFNNLAEAGVNVDTYTAPTALETTNYPGTTEVLSTTTQGITPSVNKFFIAEKVTGTSLTGISQGDIILNYSTTNAFIGLFPMSFGTNNSTNVAGTFNYQGTNGTFLGNFTASVEAYGTLNIQGFTKNVTRLRITQTLSFSIPPILNNIATLTQTVYYYYNNLSNNLTFRYSNTNVVSGFLGINETYEILEFNTSDNTLSSRNLDEASNIKVYPNPAIDFIHIKPLNNDPIRSIKVFDNQGREVLIQSEDIRDININSLQSGLYFISIEKDSGMLINEKFIKK